MTAAMESPSTSGRIVRAFENTWAAIRVQHPDVPDVVVTMGAGTTGRARERLTYGHFAASRWVRHGNVAAVNAAGVTVPELFIGGEGLARDTVEVLGTLLHEAAHGVAHTRGISDTSRQGRWHNERFKKLAEELGLVVAKVDDIGWSSTTVPAATQGRYIEQLGELEVALTVWRHAERGAGRGGRTSSNNGYAAVCDCGRRIRVSPSVYAAGPILCGLCRRPFEVEQTD